jgi:hypothetical protein
MNRKITAAVAGACLAGSLGTGAIAASGASAPSKTTVKEKQSLKFVPNRYIQDGLRWDQDAYPVKSGGTIHLVYNVDSDGPHTLTVVDRKDVPKTAGQIEKCKICEKLGKAHGADPSSNAPPKFLYLENGVGQDTPPNLDKPGDSAFIAGKKNSFVDMKVTAKPGTTLYVMCLIHPWMQARIVTR